MGNIIAVGIPNRFGLTGAKTAYKDENILLGEAQAINFVGEGVVATLNDGVLTVEVEGGGSSINVVDDLDSTSATNALSANQGNVLDNRLQAVENTQADYGDIVTYNASAFDSAGSAAAAESNAKTYADTLVVGLLDDRGNYNPTATSAYPTTGGSGVAGAILKGDLWAISTDGNVNGIAVTIGDTIRALVDDPAQVNANWAIIQNNLIYVPENSSNKASSLASPDNTKYPTTQAVATAIAGLTKTREDASFSATALANNATTSNTVNIASRYQLLQITTSHPCRVRLYTSAAKRDADLTRSIGTDPQGNHGLMFEFISTANLLSADLSPLVDGFADTAAIAYSITNLSGATQTITVTLNHVKTGA